MFAKANERAQTQTNADFRLAGKGTESNSSRGVTSIGVTTPQNPLKIPRDPCKTAEPSQRSPQSPLRGKFPRRASWSVVPPGMVTLRNFRTENAGKGAQARENACNRKQSQNQGITASFMHPLLRQPKRGFCLNIITQSHGFRGDK